jgi:hypothetical protein
VERRISSSLPSEKSEIPKIQKNQSEWGSRKNQKN